MKRRDYKELVAVMLTIVAENEGARKTEMLYGAQVVNSQGYSIVNNLKDWGLLSYDESTKMYYITSNGLRFLKAYRVLSDLLYRSKPKAGSNIS